MTSLTPRRLRRVRDRRNSAQNVSASDGKTVMPRTSRRPFAVASGARTDGATAGNSSDQWRINGSLLTATATITAMEMIRPLSRSFT